MIKILIPEPIPSLNKGELAILGGLRQILHQFGDYRLTVYSHEAWAKDDRRSAKKRYEIVDGTDLFDLKNGLSENYIPRGRFFFLKTWWKLVAFCLVNRVSPIISSLLFKDPLLENFSKTDLILANHDGMFSYLHFYIVLAGKILKKPVALYGGGTDLRTRSSYIRRKMYQYAIDHSIICAVRDNSTINFLLANHIPLKKIHLTPDPAVFLKSCSLHRVKEILLNHRIPHTKNHPLFCLVPVSGGIVFQHSFSSEIKKENKYRMRVDFWANLVNRLAKKTNAHFIFLPHCIGPVKGNDDRRMNKAIFNRIPDHIKEERFTLIETEYSATELKGIMRHSDFVLSERAHALIGAFTARTPCFALTVKQDFRMHQIIGEMFRQKTYNLNRPNLDELTTLILEDWHQRKDKQQKIARTNLKIQNQALNTAHIFIRSIKEAMRYHEKT